MTANTSAIALQDPAALVGRILLAAIFVSSGLQKMTGYSGTAEHMAGGGLAIIFGWRTRHAALAIFLFLIPVTYTFHNPAADPAQMISMMKNLAIMGGMLVLAAFGPGRWSIDGRGNRF